MKKIFQAIFVFTITIITTEISFGQNFVFLKNNSKLRGKILKYQDNKFNILLEDNSERTLNEDKVVIFFNSSGNFIYFDSDKDNKFLENQNTINNFYLNTDSNGQDFLINESGEIIFGKITNYNDNSNEIEISVHGDKKKYSKKEVQFLLNHNEPYFFSEVYEVAPILNMNKESGTFNKVESPIVQSSKINFEKNDSQINPQLSIPERTNDLSIFEDNSNSKIELKDSKILTEEQKLFYENQSKTNILLFKDKLKIIGNRNRSPREKDIAIKEVLKLFEPTATIEVSSKNKPSSNDGIEKYLRKLSNLNYDKVEIEFVNLKFVSSLTRSNDGKYRGIVSAEQSFKGFKPNSEDPVYDDFVEKNYEVIVSSFEKIKNGEKEINWKVLLGNVKLSYKQ